MCQKRIYGERVCGGIPPRNLPEGGCDHRGTVFEVREMESGKAKEHDDSSDFEAVAQVVHELYTYRDEVLLVLTKAQGSSMERMPDRLVDQMDEHNAFICEAMCKAYHVPMVEQSVVHWMSHSQIDMFIFMVTHIDDEEEYLLAGWYGLVRP